MVSWVNASYLTCRWNVDLWSSQGSSSSSASETPNNNAKTKISSPYNLVHVTHVGFDSQTGEFTGLPREWLILLQQSGISKREQQENPQVRRWDVMYGSDLNVTMHRLYWM